MRVLNAITMAAGVGIGIGFLLGRSTQPPSLPPEPGLLVQEGDLTPPIRADSYGWTGPVEIFYPIPYVSPPELIFPVAPRTFQVIEQRPDGFKMEITRCDTERTPTWRAKGLAPPRR